MPLGPAGPLSGRPDNGFVRFINERYGSHVGQGQHAMAELNTYDPSIEV